MELPHFPRAAAMSPFDGVDEALFLAAWPNLLRGTTVIVRDADTAQEISQEAILRLLQEHRAGRAPANPRSWLSRVAFNLAMSRGRRTQVERRRAPSLAGPMTQVSAEEEAIEQERFSKMRRAIAELGSDDRAILMLAASGHSGVEIARQVGRSHSAIRVRLHRLRRRVRDRLEQLEAA